METLKDSIWAGDDNYTDIDHAIIDSIMPWIDSGLLKVCKEDPEYAVEEVLGIAKDKDGQLWLVID